MKRLITVIAIMAILNLAALAVLAGYAGSHGWLARERVQRAIAALKGEQEATAVAAEEAVMEAAKPQSSGERIRRNQEVEERYLIELARREREIQDAWKLLETQGLALVREKEAFEEQKKRAAAEAQARAKESGDSGLQKELEIISGVKAKEAKDLLRQKDDADVVRILMAMEARKARQIVAACKASEERLWIGRILGKLHDSNAAQAEALGAGT
ncbi:MAG TPA: hypothetical protein VMV94_04710 [Phycisphaerae bacterium]|nr:hypothetical protein [Phycisphaerae bacterium]